MSKCKAVQYSDQKVCHDCKLVWDMNDPEPPVCKQELADRKEVILANTKAFLSDRPTKSEICYGAFDYCTGLPL